MNGPPGPRPRGWVIALWGTVNTGLGWMGPGRQREGELTHVQGLAAPWLPRRGRPCRAPQIGAPAPGVGFRGEEVAGGGLLPALPRADTLRLLLAFLCEPLSTQARRQAQRWQAGPGHLTQEEGTRRQSRRESEHLGKPIVAPRSSPPPGVNSVSGAMTLICKNRILRRLFKGQKPFDGSDVGFVCCMKNGRASLKREQTERRARAPKRSCLFSPVKATSSWGVAEGRDTVSHGSRCSVARALGCWPQPACLCPGQHRWSRGWGGAGAGEPRCAPRPGGHACSSVGSQHKLERLVWKGMVSKYSVLF